MKFQVGDRVRVVKPHTFRGVSYAEAKVGDMGTVIEPTSLEDAARTHEYLHVQLDRMWGIRIDVYCLQHDYEPVTEAELVEVYKILGVPNA